jgi:hypothetical protein
MVSSALGRRGNPSDNVKVESFIKTAYRCDRGGSERISRGRPCGCRARSLGVDSGAGKAHRRLP